MASIADSDPDREFYCVRRLFTGMHIITSPWECISLHHLNNSAQLYVDVGHMNIHLDVCSCGPRLTMRMYVAEYMRTVYN